MAMELRSRLNHCRDSLNMIGEFTRLSFEFGRAEISFGNFSTVP